METLPIIHNKKATSQSTYMWKKSETINNCCQVLGIYKDSKRVSLRLRVKLVLPQLVVIQKPKENYLFSLNVCTTS